MWVMNGFNRHALTGTRCTGSACWNSGNYIAAPTAGRLLADFGAEVIKVERPGTGDELRNWRLYAGSHLDAVPRDQPQQEVGRPRPEVRRRQGGRPRHRQALRRRPGELPARAPWSDGGWAPRTSMPSTTESSSSASPPSARPARWPISRDSPRWPKPQGACANWSAIPIGRRRGSASRSATRSPGSTPRSAR